MILGRILVKVVIVPFVLILGFVGCSSVVKKELKNKSPLLVRHSAEMPRESVSLVFPGGPSLFAANKQGATEILAFMLQEGPKGISGEDFRRQLFLQNAEVSFSSERRAFKVSVMAPQESLKSALQLVDRVLKNPKLDRRNFNRAKKKLLSLTRLRFDSMQDVVFYYGLRHAFDDHPNTFNGEGSPNSVKNIKLKDITSVYSNVVNWSSVFFAAVGPMDGGDLKGVINQLWTSRSDMPAYKRFYFPRLDGDNYKTKKRQVTLIEQKGSKDNQILFVYPENVKRDSKERVIGQVTHRLLGGGLSGDLGRELRVNRGLTYHASSFLMSSLPGWGAYTFGGGKQVSGLLSGVPEVIDDFLAKKLQSRDVTFSKNSLANRFKEGMELPYERLSEDIRFFLYDWDQSYLNRYLSLLDSVSVNDVDKFRRKYIYTQGGHLYVMGDRQRLLKVLKKLGYQSSDINIVTPREIF